MIHSLVAKYWSYKNQLLRESTLIPEALEPDREELSIVQRTLQNLENSKVPRGDTVAVEFYGEDKKPEEKISSTQVINIGTMNGQFVGFNSGKVSQSQHTEIVKTLNSLSELVEKEAPEEIKQEALGDILTLNAQLAGGNPDKSIMRKTFDKLTALLKSGLTYGAAFAQIYQVAIQPNLKQIEGFINSIGH